MNLNLKLKKLAEGLSALKLNRDALEVLSLVKISQSKSDWQMVIEEIEKPAEPQMLDRAIQYVVNGAIQLTGVANNLKETDPSTIEGAAEIVSKMGKSASNNLEILQKYASLTTFKPIISDSDQLKTAQMQWLKSLLGQEGAAKAIAETGGLLGKGGGKMIPVIGFIFSGILAIKNIYYGFYEYQKLVSEASELGISWFDTLYPNKLSHLVKQNSNEPDKLILLARITKTAKAFWDEAISAAANTLDAVKDFIFLFLEIGSMGLAIAGDIGISLVLWMIEEGTESAVHQHYDVVLKHIRTIAEDKLQDIDMQPEYFQFQETDEEALKWLEEAGSRYLAAD